MNKKEIYYKFIFPNYDKLSGIDNVAKFGTDESPILPNSDDTDQEGEVLSLCRACPERVITYDQLSADNPIKMYASKWSLARRKEIKDYVDQWLSFPKYFNLRNYWDKYPCQEGGMSLMVSHSPEVGTTSTEWTKFKSTYNNKYVYCSLVVSSGDFFYGFTLPDTVIVKSGLRDKIVLDRFHGNWYFTPPEKSIFPPNVSVGQEKRVFVQHYFKNASFPYYHDNSTIFYYVNYHDKYNNIYLHEDGRLHCVDTFGNTANEYGTAYTGSFKNFPPNELVSYYFINTDTLDNRVTRYVYTSSDVYKKTINNTPHYYLNNSDPEIEVSAMRVVEKASDFNEDLKQDFINLEATRRILYYNNDSTTLKYSDGSIRTIHPTRDIPIIESDVGGKNTVLSYEPPAEYIDENYTYNDGISGHDSIETRGTPPLQIPYNLLRYSLNDRPPFTDCETVLVMWVADNDPDEVTDGDIQGLHDLGWEQYAIPISVRCCYKEAADDKKYCNERFLVSYPYNTNNPLNHKMYKFHTRRSESYDSTKPDDLKFKEALYFSDLIDYSRDYVIAFQNKSFIKGFDIQGYLLSHYSDAFKALYIKKTYNDNKYSPSQGEYSDTAPDSNNFALSMNQYQQIYYIRVNKQNSSGNDVFKINTNGYNSSNPRICICKPNENSTEVLKPSDVIVRIGNTGEVKIVDVNRQWDFDDVTYHTLYGYNDWKINNDYFIALFDANYKVGTNNIFSKLPCTLQLKNSLPQNSTINGGKTLYEFLRSVSTSYGSWNDIYISSFGISPRSFINTDSLIYDGTGSMYFSLGLLDNYMMLNGVRYGSKINNKVVASFDRMFDYKCEDMYHFKYVNGEYKAVAVTYNYNTQSTEEKDFTSGYVCTAYIMNC